MGSTQQQILSTYLIRFRLITQTSSGSLKNMDKKKTLFFTYIHRVQITFQLGCEQRKTPTENEMQDMTKILHNVQCAAHLYLFQNSF